MTFGINGFGDKGGFGHHSIGGKGGLSQGGDHHSIGDKGGFGQGSSIGKDFLSNMISHRGADGAQGIAGKDGAQGPAGKDGANGQNGIGFDQVFAREGFDTNGNGKADRAELIAAFGNTNNNSTNNANGTQGNNAAEGTNGSESNNETNTQQNTVNTRCSSF